MLSLDLRFLTCITPSLPNHHLKLLSYVDLDDVGLRPQRNSLVTTDRPCSWPDASPPSGGARLYAVLKVEPRSREIARSVRSRLIPSGLVYLRTFAFRRFSLRA